MTGKNKKLAKERHPDREGRNTCKFQELQNAYKRIIKYIEDKQKKEEFEAEDDDFKMCFFMKHSLMKECSTRYIQEQFAYQWRRVLGKQLQSTIITKAY